MLIRTLSDYFLIDKKMPLPLTSAISENYSSTCIFQNRFMDKCPIHAIAKLRFLASRWHDDFWGTWALFLEREVPSVEWFSQLVSVQDHSVAAGSCIHLDWEFFRIEQSGPDLFHYHLGYRA